MARGYAQEDVQEKLIEILSESKTGLSGVEIAEKLGINRATMAKYLNVFAAEGVIKQKNIGNANLWFVESGTEKLQFPADYFHVKEKFSEYLVSDSQHQVYSLIRNSLHSGAEITKIISEVILPAISSVEEMYLKAKIGKSEAKMLRGIILNSIQILSVPSESDHKRNAVILSAEQQSVLYSQAASCALSAMGWQVWPLGDMSDAIDVLYDLDLQKFIAKIWKQKQGMMMIVIFSATEEGTKFFSESAVSLKPKFGKNLHVAVCSKAKVNTKAEFTSDNFEAVLQWIGSISGV